MLVFLLLITAAAAIETPYVVMDPVKDVLRISDMPKILWMGIKAGAGEPVLTEWTPESIKLTLADVSCEVPQDSTHVTCQLPASGSITASTIIQRNDSTVFVTSDTYNVGIQAVLEGASWGPKFTWVGPGTLRVVVIEQTPEERRDRVWRGIVSFLPAMLATFLATLMFKVTQRTDWSNQC